MYKLFGLYEYYMDLSIFDRSLRLIIELSNYVPSIMTESDEENLGRDGQMETTSEKGFLFVVGYVIIIY